MNFKNEGENTKFNIQKEFDPKTMHKCLLLRKKNIHQTSLTTKYVPSQLNDWSCFA